jgi:hypothetical protein
VAKGGFEFGKSHLDGVEIRAVRGQIQDAGSHGGDRLLNTCDFMAGQVIADHDIAACELGAEDLLDIGQESAPIHRAVQKQRSADAVAAQSGNKSCCLPMTVRDLGKTPLTAKAAAIKPAHLGVEPGLIKEDEAPDVPVLAALLPGLPRGRNVGPILLGGA